MKPTVADYRMSNLLILRRPVAERPSVTAEVASSSLVVPAILFSRQSLARRWGSANRRWDSRGGTGMVWGRPQGRGHRAVGTSQ
jgi:hypothetical protein